MKKYKEKVRNMRKAKKKTVERNLFLGEIQKAEFFAKKQMIS